jgi:hypothetical protein
MASVPNSDINLLGFELFFKCRFKRSGKITVAAGGLRNYAPDVAADSVVATVLTRCYFTVKARSKCSKLIRQMKPL